MVFQFFLHHSLKRLSYAYHMVDEVLYYRLGAGICMVLFLDFWLNSIDPCIYFWAKTILFLILLLYIKLEVGNIIPFLFSQGAFAIQVLLWFHINFSILCLASLTNITVFDGNLYVIFRHDSHFGYINHPIHEHGLSFHLLMPLSKPFSNIL